MLERNIRQLLSFIAIPSISTDPAYRGSCRRAAEWLVTCLDDIGFIARIEETAGQPIVHASYRAPDRSGQSRRRILFYGHYDVQPPDPLERWHTPPFEPVVVDQEGERRTIIGRGAADDKGQLLTFLLACRAWIEEAGSLPVDVDILIEGEEEIGSPNIGTYVGRIAADLAADAIFVCDTNMWDPKTPLIVTSLRGLVQGEVRITCAVRDLHSGIYGGAAENASHVLCLLLAGLKDEHGRITIPGFYDDLREPPRVLQQQWQSLGFSFEEFLAPIGLARSAGEDDRPLIEQIQSRPTFDVNGLWSGHTGPGTKTIIPHIATAKVSFRTVAGQDPRKIWALFERKLRANLPANAQLELELLAASASYELDRSSPFLGAVSSALASEWGREPIQVGSGVSIPIVGTLRDYTGADVFLVGFGLPDDAIHAPNEKYDVRSFHKGTRSWVRIINAIK